MIDNRELLIKLFKKNNLPYSIYYPIPINKQKAYNNIYKTKIINAENTSQNIINLPISAYLKSSDQVKVMKVIKKYKELCK